MLPLAAADEVFEMKILVDISHPAHVHFYKNFIREMRKRGHKFIVTARDKDVALSLLEAYGIEYETIGKMSEGRFSLFKEWLVRDRKIYSIAKEFQPDILTGIHNPCVAHVAKLTGAKSIIFTDTEHGRLANLLTFPFADVICTPSCFKKDLGKKQVRYNGYHELAYLHPNCFQPDPSVLNELSLSENDKYFIVRFVSWGAIHDIGQQGLDQAAKRRLVGELKNFGRVLLTSEGPLPDEFEQYRISVPPERIHDLLYYAMMYIGEGATMATEAAVLGTPSIYISSLASKMGNFVELEEEYGMVFVFKDVEPAIGKVAKLLQQPNLKQDWAQKRERLLTDKINVTKFMMDFVENYPYSLKRCKALT